METFKELINQKVEKLFLVVWPPLGEEKEARIDISIGFVFNSNLNNLIVVSTDKNDMWTPCLFSENVPKVTFSWSVFNSRMKKWMRADKEQFNLEYEYYDVTNAEDFKNIVHTEIKSIQMLSIKNISNSFGVKIIFNDDYILSTPISDGNTIETLKLFKNSNLLYFNEMGIMEFKTIGG